MSDPSDEKARPQIQPDMPTRDEEPEIEDPELRSGHLGRDDENGPAPSE